MKQNDFRIMLYIVYIWTILSLIANAKFNYYAHFVHLKKNYFHFSAVFIYTLIIL